MLKDLCFTCFAWEMRHNPELYVDQTCNRVNLTTLAESAIEFMNMTQWVLSDEEDALVFDYVVDWFYSWTGHFKFNND